MTDDTFSQRIGLHHTAFQEFQTVLRRVADKAFVFGCGPVDAAETVRFMIVRVSPDNGQTVLHLILRALERIESTTGQRDWRVEDKAWPQFTQIHVEREGLLNALPQLSSAIERELDD